MIRVGIIGCGKIADQHAASIKRISGCRLVGVCDSEALMAEQLADRFNVAHHFNDAGEFLEKAHPEIVHITTPALSHLELGKLCLEAGCHVYIEKPFTVNASDAETLIDKAREKDLKLTVGHNLQFNHVALRLKQLISDGYLGGDPVHMESYYGYDLGDERYAKAVLGDKKHWVRSLPGKLMHNLISHGISKIVEFIEDDNPKVIASGFTSPLLKSINEGDIIDESRVIIQDCKGTTAYFTFSTQMRPVLRHFRIYGPQNAIFVDDDNQTLIKVGGKKYKSYLDQFVPPYLYAKQYIANSTFNIKKFLKRDFHNDSGMKHLIESFYGSVKNGKPLPIAYNKILLTAKIMDSIFASDANKVVAGRT